MALDTRCTGQSSCRDLLRPKLKLQICGFLAQYTQTYSYARLSGIRTAIPQYTSARAANRGRVKRLTRLACQYASSTMGDIRQSSQSTRVPGNGDCHCYRAVFSGQYISECQGRVDRVDSQWKSRRRGNGRKCGWSGCGTGAYASGYCTAPTIRSESRGCGS